ncbi:response regulator [Ruegeria profundi]|uniref:hypothetical protein n=1 Tax=Ruegeria profundi TaxID=1685378 RepID=UPI001CD3244E|nr:hypothetical protein [Ruegeria profundi]MCA0930415.1 hypothetical protein [Ruegeria profundi]
MTSIDHFSTVVAPSQDQPPPTASQTRLGRSSATLRATTVKPLLLLHVGQTKAGSTAIQNYLDAERLALRAHGVWVPEIGFARANPFAQERTAGHLQFVRMLAAGQTGEIDTERQATPHSVCMLSAESLFVNRPDLELQALADYFSGYEVQIVAVLRHAAGWLESRYIENCLSGFSNDTRTFPDFCDDCAKAGQLDYAARLVHLTAIFRAQSTVVVNYDAAKARNDLVLTFADVCGLPITNPDLAKTIQANVRKKYLALVEGKRRLNHVTKHLGRNEALEFEMLLRSKTEYLINHTQETPASFAVPGVPLSAQHRATVEASNRRLSVQFGLEPAFPALQTAHGDPFSHRMDVALVDEIVAEGLTLLARLAFRAGEDEGGLGGTWLASPDAGTVITLLRDSRNSVHIGEDLSATISAMFTRRLVTFIPGNSTRREQIDALLAQRLPSEILCIELNKGTVSILEKYTPEVIVCGAGADLGALQTIADTATDLPVIVLTSHDDIEAAEVGKLFSCTVQKLGDKLWVLAGLEAKENKATSASKNVAHTAKVDES